MKFFSVGGHAMCLPPSGIASAATAAAAEGAARGLMARRAARIASARRAGGIAAATSTAVMHQHRNHHRLGERVAAVLAFVGLFFLAAVRIVSRPEGLGMGLL